MAGSGCAFVFPGDNFEFYWELTDSRCPLNQQCSCNYNNNVNHIRAIVVLPVRSRSDDQTLASAWKFFSRFDVFFLLWIFLCIWWDEWWITQQAEQCWLTNLVKVPQTWTSPASVFSFLRQYFDVSTWRAAAQRFFVYGIYWLISYKEKSQPCCSHVLQEIIKKNYNPIMGCRKQHYSLQIWRKLWWIVLILMIA